MQYWLKYIRLVVTRGLSDTVRFVRPASGPKFFGSLFVLAAVATVLWFQRGQFAAWGLIDSNEKPAPSFVLEAALTLAAWCLLFAAVLFLEVVLWAPFQIWRDNQMLAAHEEPLPPGRWLGRRYIFDHPSTVFVGETVDGNLRVLSFPLIFGNQGDFADLTVEIVGINRGHASLSNSLSTIVTSAGVMHQYGGQAGHCFMMIPVDRLIYVILLGDRAGCECRVLMHGLGTGEGPFEF